MNFFSTKKQQESDSLIGKEYESDDSVDRALRSIKKANQEPKASSFRGKDGNAMYLQVNQDASSSKISLSANPWKTEDHSQARETTKVSNVSKDKTKRPNQSFNPDALPYHETPTAITSERTERRTRNEIPKILIPANGNENRRESIVLGTEELTNVNLQNENNDDPRTAKSNTSIQKQNNTQPTGETEVRRRIPIKHEGKRHLLIPTNNVTKVENRPPPKREEPKRTRRRSTPTKETAKRRSSSGTYDPEMMKLISSQAVESVYLQCEQEIQEDSTIEEMELAASHLELVRILGIRRTFFNPELEVINRFCLEYTSICVQTEPKGMITFNYKDHFTRVFEHMDHRVNSTSTPTERTAPGPEIPVLLTRLFLGEFRVTTSGTNRIELPIPALSHNNRLTNDRFKAITKNAFSRKKQYFRFTDISRHDISHLA